jgi:MoaA/NifB/PqqE/SkfB family radical SAM enzyme
VATTGMRVSLLQRLRDWREQLAAPETDWIQVEVSSYCNAACVYCPHTVYRDVWINRHLSLATFERLLPAIANTQLVHLQGWGEPFLNPDFFTMVAMAKATGTQVGTTTNGMLVDSELIERILDSGLDFISFSLAGLGAENDRFRAGTRFGTVLNAMRDLHREKQRREHSAPAIHVSYLLLRSNVDDLVKLPDTLQHLGINQVVVSGLDFVPSESLERERLPSESDATCDKILRLLCQVNAAAQSRGFAVINNLCCSDTLRGACSENPQHALFVSSDGTVSPCVFSNLPVSRAAHRVNCQTQQHDRLVFGDLGRDSLSTIWARRSYTRFRESFETERMHPICRNCHKLHADDKDEINC